MAVLRVGSIDVVLSERKAWRLDTVVYPPRGRSIRPATRWSRSSRPAGSASRYEPIAAEIIEIETTGPCDSDLTRLPFRRIPRPLWPFDPELDEPWADGEPPVTTGRMP